MSADFKLDFAGVGSVKAGTSWLAACLAEHPQVCIPAIKETNFFSNSHPTDALGVNRIYAGSNRALGLDWLQAQYHHWRAGQLRGEYSPGYLAEPDCPELLHAHNPAMKLLFSFRNPVEVLYSGYFQIRRVYPVRFTFEEAIDKFPHMIEYCRYDKHVQRFLALFPAEQVHFMLYDDIRRDAPGCFAGVCRFLGIDAAFLPPSLHLRVNPRTIPRSGMVRDLRAGVRAAVGSTRLTRVVWGRLAKWGVLKPLRKLYRLNEKPDVAPPMNPETRARLVRLFAEDNARLAARLGCDLSRWAA